MSGIQSGSKMMIGLCQSIPSSKLQVKYNVSTVVVKIKSVITKLVKVKDPLTII